MDQTAPCDWPTASCPQCGECDGVTASQRVALEEWAVFDLWAATGKVYGACTVTVYPCNDYSTLCWCGNPLRSCGCTSVPEVQLAGPVASVTSVIVGGVTLDAEDYRIDDYQWLVRLDGGTWPANADPLDPDAFSVTYQLGVAPPPGAAQVAGILACSRSACSNSGCKVPRGTTQITRQGTTMTRGGQDGTSSRPWRYEANTIRIFGIDEVDQWVRNARATTFAGAVHSPDLPTVRQTTWAASP
jgi:hypothetical protein